MGKHNSHSLVSMVSGIMGKHYLHYLVNMVSGIIGKHNSHSLVNMVSGVFGKHNSHSLLSMVSRIMSKCNSHSLINMVSEIIGKCNSHSLLNTVSEIMGKRRRLISEDSSPSSVQDALTSVSSIVPDDLSTEFLAQHEDQLKSAIALLRKQCFQADFSLGCCHNEQEFR